ncbi:transglycosylase SLT domain-containing protein [Limnobacter humi]|uniref:Transglycosylase SLT domain-containing protein n=1 Tax=Limnobacter humi TaxID=1778671 RepID=A0ABT1WCI4_9BURK|nr:transglycosylase SLT domain-containing protein [Limnobacter humi]MCQ8895226.1 transglycosylase SLT domain-containing protein [Limnobacter humi]
MQGALTFDEIQKLVKENNRSKEFSDEFVICLIWKETNFNPSRTNSQTITGLMQISKGAVDMVNKLTPAGTHFEHADMLDPATNIQCGTLYLDIAKNKLGGIDASFGTGKGYSKSIHTCEACLKGDTAHPMVALHKIHL